MLKVIIMGEIKMKNKILLVALFIFTFIVKVNGQDLTSCDYLIIAPSTFISSTSWDDDLITLQQSRGFAPYLSVISDGTTAEGIKDIISTAYNNGTQLKYVLLIGNGSHVEPSGAAARAAVPNIYTIQGAATETANFSVNNFIPFWSVTSNNFWGDNGVSEVASDDPYISDLSGNGTVYIGRIPADTKYEIEDYVGKLTTYYNNMSTSSSHNLKELYIGKDISDTTNGCTAIAVNFLRDDLINNHIPSSINVTQLNVSENIFNGAFGFSYERSELFEDALNSGVALISMLSTQGGPVDLGGWYWNSDEADYSFTNSNKLPFLLGMNCMQGYVNDRRWNNYNKSAMRELMMFANGGIIGSIAPTEGSVQHINGKLLNLAHDKIFNEGIVNVAELLVFLKDRVLQDNYSYEFFANGLTLFADPSMPLSVYQYKSGNITSSTTWEGNIFVTGNVIVNNAVTLTIESCTNITFQNNSKLIVNGTLNVNGTSGNKVQFDFQTPYSSDGEYNGIDIKQGGSATIYYAEIKNAQYGIKAEKTAITVENSDIHNCVIGTYLYWTNDYGFSEIHSNNLHDNSCCGLYVYHSEAKARDNQIKNNGNRGVFAGNHSTLYLGEAGYAGNNNISNNTTVGIFSDYGSYMFLGRETCTLQGGNNIVNNPSKNARASGYGSVIQAENTWWGSNNQSTITSKFYIYHGQIYYHPWLSSAPSGVLSKSVTTPEESVYNAEFTSSDKSEPESATSEDKQYNYDSKWPIYWKLLYARNLIFVKDYKFARKICREVIDENPDSSLSFWALNLLGVASYQDDPEGFKEYLQKKTSSKEKKQLYGSMELILSGYETTKSSKEASIDKTTTKYEGTYIEEVGLLQKFMYYLNEEKDEKTARSISDELDKKFPKTVSALEAHRFLGDDVKESEEIKGKIAKENGKEDNESIPEKYELLGNYPNPFNPSTTIKYALPFNSNVELTIYDMNGKEVRKFVINTQSKGYGNVVWDGTNNNGIQVSSGVYVYKFKAISLEGNGKVFEKSSKLMMLK